MSTAYINRELSWTEFNQRVLDEAKRKDLPLLERVKFLAITASNLDEFFQVRVGGLKMMLRSGSRAKDVAGLTPNQQLSLLTDRLQKMTSEQYSIWNKLLIPELGKKNIVPASRLELSQAQRDEAASYFRQSIFPLLTPIEIDPEAKTLSIPPLQIVILCELKGIDNSDSRFVLVAVPPSIHRLFFFSDSESTHFIFSENLISLHIHELFPNEELLDQSVIRVTRNGDIAVQEEDAIDLAGEMEEVLQARRFSDTVRLEIREECPKKHLNLITKLTGVTRNSIYKVNGPLALTDLMSLSFISGFDELREESWLPQSSPAFNQGESIFETLSERDVLLIHPYESFEPVIRLLEEAATDPKTVAIKQVLYRTASNSQIISALIKAAENGKQVTALVELKARFDESRNLNRADELQRAGVQIVYGVKGLKTHAKIALIVRNEDGHLKRYVHLGTGNYNESTARLYTDVSYLTSRPEYVSDASLFFNAITGRSKLVRLEKLVPAPTHMKARLIQLIEGEAHRAREGQPARIMAKINSLQDKEIIDALYKASKAGVEILINVRGICCLKPGKRKEAANIRVVSIVDRFLEHIRAFCFHQGGDNEIFISSADWMTRNLDKRVELMIPIEDRRSKRRVLKMLESCFKDNTQSSLIQEDGTSKKIKPKAGTKSFRLQKELYNQASKAAKTKARTLATTFEPHLPQD